MPSELLREIQKLETRLKNFIERGTGSKIEELMNLRLEVVNIFRGSLTKMMEA